MSDLSDMSTLSEPEDETGALQETNKKSQEDSSDSDSMVSDEGGPYRPCGDTHCTASKCMKNIGVGWDAEMMKMFIWVTPVRGIAIIMRIKFSGKCTGLVRRH